MNVALVRTDKRWLLAKKESVLVSIMMQAEKIRADRSFHQLHMYNLHRQEDEERRDEEENMTLEMDKDTRQHREANCTSDISTNQPQN